MNRIYINNDWEFTPACDAPFIKGETVSGQTRVRLHADVDGLEIREGERCVLTEGSTFDAAAVRIRMEDQNGNLLPYYNGPVLAEGRRITFAVETKKTEE